MSEGALDVIGRDVPDPGGQLGAKFLAGLLPLADIDVDPKLNFLVFGHRAHVSVLVLLLVVHIVRYLH